VHLDGPSWSYCSALWKCLSIKGDVKVALNGVGEAPGILAPRRRLGV
jgi:hypothetical protein